MAINTLTLAQNMTDALEKVIVQKPVTGFFADNALQAKFVGANTVLIPDMDMSGLGDYDRDTGFVQGSVTIGRTPYTLTMDRGRTFQIDAQDEDESGIPSLAGEVSGEFVRTKVCPEIDAYCLSKLAGFAAGQNQTITADGELTEDVYNMFLRAVSKAQAAVGYDEELVCFVDATVYDALQASPAFERHIAVNDFKKGDLNLTVRSINGVAILPVPDSRMKTAYDFLDGTTSGQTDGGFAPTDAAKSIGMLVCPKRAASLVRKTDTVRIFEPSKNPNADAWKIDYRVYYDLLLKKSMQDGIVAYTY
ncbi:MAG: hypothetical protein IJW89_04415 [Clostridia bacterium]|nr:hypothetical protein [Clostridia bacterium]